MDTAQRVGQTLATRTNDHTTSDYLGTAGSCGDPIGKLAEQRPEVARPHPDRRPHDLETLRLEALNQKAEVATATEGRRCSPLVTARTRTR